MTRGYNFGAGPSMLPESILRDAQKELLDWQHLGLSVLEIGHRSLPFTNLMEDTQRLLRELLIIPDNYHVLFLSGAARIQFAMIPMNFLAEGEEAGYLVNGIWSNLAYEEAARLKKAYRTEKWTIKPKSRYFYYTPNETIDGIRIEKPSQLLDAPLIADMTSCLLTEPINIADYGLIFAGAQKNIANAGLTLVIVSDELLASIANDKLPTMLDYRTHSTTNSTYATLPTFNCYLAYKMFCWIKEQGGVEALYKLNCQKAKLLYDCIDNSSMYHSHLTKETRSLVNICFNLADPKLEELFLENAKERNLLALKGHRLVGGLRASIYNSMPLEGVEQLVEFMNDFARKYS